MLGGFFIFIALISTILCSYYYLSSFKQQKEIKLAKFFYFSSLISLLMASGFLLWNILSHNFQIAYIYNYTSKELPFSLLIASFFAGQEGSFLFWTVIIALLGLFLQKQKNDLQGYQLSLFFYSIILLFFVILVIFNSPFSYIWDKYPNIFYYNFLPDNGRSLNPILENFWMIIHPPFLFLGYSILLIPFVLFVGHYYANSLNSAIDSIRKWQLLGSGILAIGLILGGVWAYESLGWGGWWGWDPVENASLIPWIMSVILIHLLLIQKRKNGFIKSNFFLFFTQTILIIYSTFLTRTGILQNSLHSFTGTSLPTFYILIFIIIILFISSFYIFIKNRKKYSLISQNSSMNLKEGSFYLSSAMYAFLLIALFILFGTSFPLINSNFSISTNFYNEINFVPLIVSMLLLAVAYFIYRKNIFRQIKNIISIIVFTSIIIIASIIYGIKNLPDLIFIFSCSIVIAVSLISIFTKNKKNITTEIAHLGFGILFIGVIFSGNYSSSSILTLSNLDSASFNNRTITYIKSERFDTQQTDREKYRFITAISQKSDTLFAMPIMFIKDKQIYKEPAIKTGVLQDIYISPLALDSTIIAENYFFSNNSITTLSNNINFQFKNLIMPENDTNLIGALINYTYANSTFADTIFAKYNSELNLFSPIWKYYQNIDLNIGLYNIINNEKVQFVFAKNDELPLKKKENFMFEISFEPLMSLVWLGSFTIIFSMILSSLTNRR